ncbi:MAG: VOC family protein [Acetatifactor sp.]|nr:VOC family protein [Acetatifactor sp.]
MKIGEVCLCTNDVITLASFYKKLFGIDNCSDDEVHQTLIAEETQFTIYNDGSRKNNNNQNISLAFTVEDIDSEYEKLLAMGAEIIEKPTRRPWGTVNMSFFDPDRNVMYIRSFLE